MSKVQYGAVAKQLSEFLVRCLYGIGQKKSCMQYCRFIAESTEDLSSNLKLDKHRWTIDVYIVCMYCLEPVL